MWLLGFRRTGKKVKRGDEFFDQTFFTVMQLVACQSYNEAEIPLVTIFELVLNHLTPKIATTSI